MELGFEGCGLKVYRYALEGAVSFPLAPNIGAHWNLQKSLPSGMPCFGLGFRVSSFRVGGEEGVLCSVVVACTPAP